MEFVVYIQSLNGYPWDDWACSAYLGFKNRGSKIVLFEQIEEVPHQRWVILIASVENTREWLLKMRVAPEKLEPLNIPSELWKQRFLGREVFRSTMGQLRAQEEWMSIFIKPAKVNKAWPAFVAYDRDEFDFWLHDLKDDEPVLCSEQVDIDTEYRCYIQEGKLVGMKHYLGNPLVFPNAALISEMISCYKNAPAAYSLDIGVTEDLRETILIECNDGWSLGNYGLNPDTYVRFLMARWRELMGIR